MIDALQYVGFTSPAFAEWRTFGTEVLGAELAEDGADGAVRLRLDDAGYRVAVHPGEADGLRYLGWRVDGPDDLVALAKRLTDIGVEVSEAPPELLAERQVVGLITFTDPCGLRHEAGWGQLFRPATFRPGRAISHFVTGDGGLGHVVLVVPDIDAEERFLVDVLGFRLSDVINAGPVGLRFYHCNERHHTIALIGVPGVVGVHHLMLEVGSIDDVGRALELVTEREIPLAMSLGRHVNDLMTSIYVRTPSGFELEYGTGGLLVDVDNWKAGAFESISIWGHHPTEGLPPGSAIGPAEPAGVGTAP